MSQKNDTLAGELQHLGRRSLYNYVRFHQEQVQGGCELEAWEVEDYRLWSLEQLFQSLHAFGWQLDRSLFCAYAENSDGPEALIELLLAEDQVGSQEEDQIFLIVFELWRRLVPHASNLEFLADELDYQIFAYEHGEQVDDKIDKALSRLLTLMQDPGHDEEHASAIFDHVAAACVHDLEMFLYDFILDQFEAGAHDYAGELHGNFLPYVATEVWFEFLQVHWSDNEEASALLKKIYKTLKSEPQADLLWEIVAYLSETEVDNWFQLFFELLSKEHLDEAEKEELKALANSYLKNHQSTQGARSQLLACLGLRP